MRYKLAVFDLDGTLLNSNKVLTPKVLEKLRIARSCGLWVTVSTGRTFPSAKPYVEAIDMDGPVSFQNGALILSLKPLEIFRLVIFPKDSLKEALLVVKELELYPMLFSPFFDPPYILMERTFPKESPFRSYFEKALSNAILLDDIGEAMRLKLAFNELVVVGKIDRVRKFIAQLEGRELSFVFNSFVGDEAFLEVYGPDCSKERSLIFFSEFYNISLDQIIFVGDNLNDLDAIKCAGLGVAMGNAPEEVKEEADLVIPSSEEDGVACFLEEIITEKSKVLQEKGID